MATKTYRQQPDDGADHKDKQPDKAPESQAPTEPLRPDDGQEDVGPAIDTSKMNEGQRQALEVAEAARETEWKHPSFAKQLFMGRFDADVLLPFPVQDPADRAVGDSLIDQLTKLFREELDPEEVDATRTIPEHVVEEMHRLGVFAMKVPKDYGGLGFSQVNYNRVMQMIASHCASTAVLVSAHQSIGVPQPLKLFGTEAQKRQWFPKFRQGAVSAFALTEPGVGSDPAQMSTTASLSADGSHYLINGEKLWCTNGPIADVLVVMAQTAPKMVRGKERKQITAFIVDGSSDGIEVVHRCDFMGIRGIQNGLLKFNDVKVPVENVLWGEGKGLKLALTTLNTGRLTLPAACAGAAKQCLLVARQWGREREQWGHPIGKHEAGAVKIGYIAATTLAMEAMAWLTSHWADDKGKDIRLEAAMAKLFCSTALWRVVDETMQLRGGRGYEKGSSLKARGEHGWGVERMLRDARINRIIEGTDEIMRLFMAREAMDPHLSVAGDLLRPGVPIGKKFSALVSTGLFYAKWYPLRWLGLLSPRSHSRLGALAGHYRWVGRQSHKLARTIFHAMALNGPKLERRQMLLGRLMEIGTELTAMAATCAYAMTLSKRDDRAHTIQLADLFCRQARVRIADHYDHLRRNTDSTDARVAKQVLADELTWLEDGILPMD